MAEHRYGEISGRVSRLFQLRVVQVAVVFAVFVALLAAVLPYGLSEGLKLWLRESGARQVSIGDVQFNLFTARFRVRDAHFDTDSAEPVNVVTIEGTLSQANLLRGRILFDRLLIRNATLVGSRTQSGASWRIGGISLNDSPSVDASSSSPGKVGVRVLQIENSTASLALPKGNFDLRINSARLENLIPWAMNETSTLDMAGEIAGAAAAINGKFSPHSRRPSVSINLTATRLPVSSLALFFDTGGLSPQGRVSLRGAATAEFDGADMTSARYEGTIDGERLSLQFPNNGTAQIEGLSWKGVFHQTKDIGFSGQLGARGVTLKLAGVPSIVATEVRLNEVRLAVPGSGSLQSFAVEGLTIGPMTPGAEGDPPAGIFSAGKILGGKGTLGVDGADLLRSRYQGSIEASDLTLHIADVPGGHLESISWQGGLSAEKGGEVFGRLSARGLKMTLAADQQITASEIGIDDFRVGISGSGSLQSFVIKNFEADSSSISDKQSPQPAAFSATVLRGGPMALLSDDLKIQEIIAEEAQLRFVRRGDGLMGPNRLFGGDEAPPQEKKSGGFNFNISRVKLAKGSVLNFHDENVKPAFVMAARLDEFEVENIDNHRPGLATKFTVKGSVDEYTRFEADGLVEPFGMSLAGEIQVRAERISLPSLTPYLAQEAGYAFKSGIGDLEANIKIDKGTLNAGSVITLKGMEVEPIRPDAASFARASLSMPVDAVLSLLRDKNSDIKLKIPVTGDISAPRFNFSDVFAKAAAGAMKSASLGFLKYALQPFGAVIMAGELARDINASIRLDPLIFQEGNSILEPRHMPFLEKIAAIMEERPGLRIKLCSRVIPGDRLALAAQRKVAVTAISDKDVIDLATARVDAIMEEVVQRRGLASARIIACQPKVDAEPGAAPRVELLI